MKQFIPFLAFLFMFESVQARTIHVPQDFPTIKAAVDSTVDGDEVVVSPGTYNEGFTIHKIITVRSTFDGKDWSIIQNTIIKPPNSRQEAIGINAGSNNTNLTIRGFTITRDPIASNVGIIAQGIVGGNDMATIEYNIIENQVYRRGGFQTIEGLGAAIYSVNGVIQNNIIRNNHADDSVVDACTGNIRNNIFYGNDSYPLARCTSCLIFNNTLVDNGLTTASGPLPAHTAGIVSCSGVIANNILWSTDGPSVECANPSVPQNCIIKGYTGSGIGIITSDPKFVDAANHDYHLQASSPAIDAGIATTGVKADFQGVQRGLGATTQTQTLGGPPPRGTAIDIGAYEYIPKPVAVWLPKGQPDVIRAGDTLTVAWQMDVPPAGTAIILQLFDDRRFVADFGAFFSPTGAGESQVTLTGYIPTGNNYYIKGISSWDHNLAGFSPFMTIESLTNAAQVARWSRYE